MCLYCDLGLVYVHPTTPVRVGTVVTGRPRLTSRTATSCTPAGEPEGAREQTRQSTEAVAEPAPPQP